jgi:hypothetical protein
MSETLNSIEPRTVNATCTQSFFDEYDAEISQTWSPGLKDKIDRQIILEAFLCYAGIFIRLLMNNPNVTFPVSSDVPSDNYVYGLPNMCEPGANTAGQGYSREFSAYASMVYGNYYDDNGTANSFPGIQRPGEQIVYFDSDAISAKIGNSFFNSSTTKNFTQYCYNVVLYCYGYLPMYMYAHV